MIHIFSTPERVLKLQPSLSRAAEGEATGLWHVQHELRVQTAARLLAIAFQLDLLHQRAKRLFSFAFVPPVAFHWICPIPAVDLTLCLGGVRLQLRTTKLGLTSQVASTQSVGQVNKVLWTKFTGSQTSHKSFKSQVCCHLTNEVTQEFLVAVQVHTSSTWKLFCCTRTPEKYGPGVLIKCPHSQQVLLLRTASSLVPTSTWTLCDKMLYFILALNATQAQVYQPLLQK